ncbi:MAG: hypothetical protein K0U21_06230 [Proteobacteria bacterium]|nr:hypothetical protein [Pseudomonadota bacterium]
MQKNELIKSWLFIVLFWWVVGYAILSYNSGVNFVDEIKSQTAYWLDYLTNGEQPVREVTEDAITNEPMDDWTLFGLSLVFLSFSLGVSLVFFARFAVHKNQLRRIKPRESWRGISVSYGQLPLPAWMQITPEFQSNDLDFSTLVESNKSIERLQKLYDELGESYKKVVRDVLYIIASNPDAHVGHGHEINSEETPHSLLEHTIRVLAEGWSNNDDPLLPIVLVAHDLGKIPVWEKKGFGTPAHTWTVNGYHDDRGSLMLSSLKSIESLTDDEITVVSICVKYCHKTSKKPSHPKDELNARIDDILCKLNNADHATTAEEQFLVIQRTPEEIYFNAIEQALINLKWNHSGSSKGTQNSGWRKDDIAYVNPDPFSEAFLEYLPNDQRAALKTRSKGNKPFLKATLKLIEILKSKDMLIHPDFEPKGNNGDEYLWTLTFAKTNPKANELVMKGLMCIKLPPELRGMPETSYDFSVEPYSVGIPTTSKEMEKKLKDQTEEDKALLVTAALYGITIEEAKKRAKASASQETKDVDTSKTSDTEINKSKKKPLERKSKKIEITLNPDEFSLTPL